MKVSRNRAIKHTKVMYHELEELDNLVTNNKNLTANQMKTSLNLRASSRTVQKYLNLLGWRKIRVKYCQYVSKKNRIARLIFCKFCLLSFQDDAFQYSIFLDKCTVMMVKNAPTQWFRDAPGEIRLVGKYKHETSVHIIGAISRRG